MKKITSNNRKSIALAVVFVLVSMVLIPLGTGFEEEKTFMKEETIGSFASYHKVFAEFGTTTTCPYCVSHKNYLPQVSGDFTYVALVANMNSAASQRFHELAPSPYYVPDTFFDGGYTHVLGGISSVTPLQNAYNACQGRTVADVDLSLSAYWDETDNSIDTTVVIDNDGGSVYNGHLHVYVCEKFSRWINTNDQGHYANAMLGYAINKNINVGGGDSLTETSYGFTFPDIQQSNILVVATVFRQSTSYADECDTAEPTSGGDDDDDNDDDVQIPKTKISYPYSGLVLNGTVIVTGTSHHPEGDQKLKWTAVKIDYGGWELTDDIIWWSYEWDSTKVEDGEHTISAICSDGIKQSGIYQVDVEVKNNEEPDPDKIPDLEGKGSISWIGIKPRVVVSGEFTVENIGDSESELDWEIADFPNEWGTWSFDVIYGYDLTPEDGKVTINIQLVAPDVMNQEFSGEIRVVNKEDENDYDVIPVSLSTSKNKVFEIYPLLLRFLEQHPNMFPILRILMKNHI